MAVSSATTSADWSACAWTGAWKAGVRALRFAGRVSESGQFVSRREEALLQVRVLVLSRARLTGCAIAAVGLFCRPGCGAGDQRVPPRRRPWRSAGQELSEMGGVGDPGAGIVG